MKIDKDLHIKILYCIKSCHKNKYRRESQQQTWLNHIDAGDNYYYMLGGSHLDEPHIFNTDAPDDYDSLTTKLSNFIINLQDKDYDHFFFCDDDTFVFPHRLKNLIKENSKYETIGRTNIVREARNSNHKCRFPVRCYSGGGGYALSINVLNRLQNYLRTTSPETRPMCVHDDVCIGWWLADVGISEESMLDFGSVLRPEPGHIENRNLDWEKVIAFYNCEPTNMNLAYKKMQASTK